MWKLVSEVNWTKSSIIWPICSRSSLRRLKDINKNAISTLWIILKVSQKVILWFHFTSFSNHVAPVCYWRIVVKHSASRSLIPQDLLSYVNVSMVSLLQSLLLLFQFCVFLSQLPELVWKLVEEISLQSASKRFPSFGPPANGNKSSDKSPDFAQIETY